MRYLNGFCLGLTVMALASCSKSDSETEKVGNWMTRAVFGGDTRSEAVSFVIGDTAYVGTGIDYQNNKLNDFYKYDPVKDEWTQIASLEIPGNDPALKLLARSNAVGMASDGKGYVGTGIDKDYNKLNDFYEYNPATGAWSKIGNLPGAGRYDAVAFTLKGKGYVGTGFNGSYLSDFYRLNNGTWESRTGLKDKRTEAVAFVIGDSAYVVTGKASSLLSTMYVYSEKDDQWYPKRKIENANEDEDYDNDYTTIMRSNGVGFTIGTKGYVVTGSPGNTWEYDPVNDKWTEKQAFEGPGRGGAVGFTVKGRGFVTTGAPSGNPYDDTWEFDPNAELNKYD